ncbi:MAG: CYTH domain-containing protein [Candidatus Dojkabacteria bacterium]|nr:MAG: CYTH domain-containing protein [Candidatus Dojkabacteria bacterium]
MIEIESKVMNIDVSAERKKLLRAGGIFLSKKLYRTILFKLPVAENKLRTLRLRLEGEEARIAYKEVIDSTHTQIRQRNEREVIVSDFATTHEIFLSLGYAVTHDFSKYRESYALNGATLVIDEHLGAYAVIPPLLEIEADSAQKVIETASLLGYQESDLSSVSFRDLTKQYALADLA